MATELAGRDSEREVAEFARRASVAARRARRRFGRGTRIERILEEGDALILRLDSSTRQVERQITAVLGRREQPGVEDKVQSLAHDLRAGEVQRQRLQAALDELRSAEPAPFPSRPRA